MFLDLSRIRTAHEHYEKAYAPEAFAGDRETFTVAAPVSLVFDLHKDKDQYRLVGRVTTTLELTCSRCLEPFVRPVDASFDLRYHPQTANAGAGERELQDDDLSDAFYEDETIDLGQLMREQFLLSLPMKPLCSEACHGLCPVCGTNLNRGSCDCRREWQDPRLAALEALKEQSPRKGH
ncbi:MAG: YceD family protein [Betaproteobacteria bacterium]